MLRGYPVVMAALALGACQEPHLQHGLSRLAGSEAGPSCGTITYQGCCSGDKLVYCAGGKLQIKACGPAAKCGWNATFALYACGPTDAGDPSGKVPRVCPVGDGGLPDGPAPDAPVLTDAIKPEGGCGGLGYVGCCAGQNLLFCSGGKVFSQSCAPKPYCGWDAKSSRYDCGTGGGADPSKTHPKSCSAVVGDAGIPDLVTDLGIKDQQIPLDLSFDAASDQSAGKDGFTTLEGSSSESSKETSAQADSDHVDTSGLDAAVLDTAKTEDTGEVVAGGGGGCGSCEIASGAGRLDPLPWLLLLLSLLWRRR
jgi:hypothetical protein